MISRKIARWGFFVSFSSLGINNCVDTKMPSNMRILILRTFPHVSTLHLLRFHSPSGVKKTFPKSFEVRATANKL